MGNTVPAVGRPRAFGLQPSILPICGRGADAVKSTPRVPPSPRSRIPGRCPSHEVQSTGGEEGKEKRERMIVVVKSPCRENCPANAYPSAHKAVLESANPARTRSVHLDAPDQRHGQQPVSRTADPGVVEQDKSSRGSVDTTKTRSGPQRVRMNSGERPIGAAKGKQSDTEALCQTPPPHPTNTTPIQMHRSQSSATPQKFGEGSGGHHRPPLS